MKSKQFEVTGRVQGVFFRKYTEMKANELGLKGFVMNQENGSVYCEAEGGEGALLAFEKWLWEGSPLSSVLHVSTQLKEPSNFAKFEIRYSS